MAINRTIKCITFDQVENAILSHGAIIVDKHTFENEKGITVYHFELAGGYNANKLFNFDELDRVDYVGCVVEQAIDMGLLARSW